MVRQLKKEAGRFVPVFYFYIVGFLFFFFFYPPPPPPPIPAKIFSNKDLTSKYSKLTT
jgi:hypothetical protein